MHIDFGYGCYDGGIDYRKFPHGKGKITYYKEGTTIPDGTVEAEFNHGVFVGDVTVDYLNGAIYVGAYDKDNGWRVGYGKMTYADGGVYEGEWKENLRHGKGTLYLESGSKYVGDFRDDFMDGFGTYYFSNGNVYEGEFVKDFFNGKGKMTYANGDVYEGDFVNDRMEGKGTLVSASGNKYVGDFIGDMMEGTGTLYNKEGEVLFEGKWKENNPVQN